MGVQCYELFGGIALKIHTFSFFFSFTSGVLNLWGIPHLSGMASCQVGNDNFTEEAEDIEEQFLDLVHDSAAKAVFTEKSLNAFLATMYGSYPRVAVAALTLLVAFPSTYLCESAFSSMVQIKTKWRNRLIDLESDFRCAISKVEPKIEALVQAKQMQKSQ